MATTVNVLRYKAKVLSNGECPLMLRVTKDRKRKYVGLGVSVNPKFWNFSKNEPKAACPNREYIEMLIADKIKEYSAKIIEFKVAKQDITPTTLVEKVNDRPKSCKTVDDVFKEQMAYLVKAGRKSYAQSIQQTYNSLKEYRHNLNFCFDEIDVNWLKRYEQFLREKRLSENTIGIRFRNLRAIYNVAVEEDVVSSDRYPFKKFKIARMNQETIKRALTKADIERILSFKSSNNFMRGCGVYYTNDASGDYFPERYFLDSNEDWEYFETLDETADFVSKIVGVDVEPSVNAIQKALGVYVEEHEEENEDLFYSFHEFNVCKD